MCIRDRVQSAGVTSPQDQPSRSGSATPRVQATRITASHSQAPSKPRVQTTGATSLEAQASNNRALSQPSVQTTGATSLEAEASNNRDLSQQPRVQATGDDDDDDDETVTTVISIAHQDPSSHLGAAMPLAMSPLSSRPVPVKEKVSQWLTSSALGQEATTSSRGLTKDQGISAVEIPSFSKFTYLLIQVQCFTLNF